MCQHVTNEMLRGIIVLLVETAACSDEVYTCLTVVAALLKSAASTSFWGCCLDTANLVMICVENMYGARRAEVVLPDACMHMVKLLVQF